jgi:carboxypeptidase Taq
MRHLYTVRNKKAWKGILIMHPSLDQLKAHLAEVADLSYARSVLGWDMQVNMPPGGAEGRSLQMAALSRVIHNKVTVSEIGQLLEDLQHQDADLDPDSDEARLLFLARRAYNKISRVPVEWVSEFSRLTSSAHHVWTEARAENNFEKFRPLLEKILEMRRSYAGFFTPYEHVYDPLLDDYEPGMKTFEVQGIFDVLRQRQTELIRAIGERPQVDDSFLYQDYDEGKQWDFGVEVVEKFGYDWQHGRQDRSAHPFTSKLAPGDVRITTRFSKNDLSSALFATMHECGHALHGLGLDPSLERTPLGFPIGGGSGGMSQAISESQSRMWENQVGRSFPFWEYFFPRLTSYFPAQLGSVRVEDFYKGVNRVQPSLIRVEADEGTYTMHILLRMELEIALMEGSLETRHLPEAWNAGMHKYLGLKPDEDKDGVLQDVHWSSGYIGYFPTYALGNVIAAQLWEQVMQDLPGLEDGFRRGEFGDLLSWLREKVHRHGRKYTAQELVQRVTGEPISSEPYLRYLEKKYGEIYALG